MILLAPHLTEETADELLASASRRTKSEVERLLADRFPRPDLPVVVLALVSSSSRAPHVQHAPGRVPDNPETHLEAQLETHAEAQLASPAIETPAPRPRLTPLAPQRFALQVTVSQDTHDKLRQAQALLSHTVPAGDVAQVLARALDALIRELEKRKFAATQRPQRRQRPSKGERHIPAAVKRTVWERDQGQCTYVSESGRRCASRTLLEFDHTDEVARGGQATVDRMRLRCRAHNQYAAEGRFGAEFMHNKRQEAADARKAKKEEQRARGDGRADRPGRSHESLDSRRETADGGTHKSAGRRFLTAGALLFPAACPPRPRRLLRFDLVARVRRRTSLFRARRGFARRGPGARDPTGGAT